MNSSKICLLAIESSCDDTAAAISINNHILCNLVYNQEIHSKYGGVVPELASRAHQSKIVPVVAAALEQSGITKNLLNGIAVTTGPGLQGSLLVGLSFAKSMAQILDIPLIAVNHMQAHVLAHLIDDGSPIPPFPFLCLTVSGGHTQLLVVHSASNMEVLGTTLDDAVGEAFDKSAKILGLPYPGGPLIDQYAKLGNGAKYKFSIPQIEGLNFSFSGIKTQILYFLQQNQMEDSAFIQKNLPDICASIQGIFVEILMKKLIKASKVTGIRHVAISGGVSANSHLRNELQSTGKFMNWKTYIPAFEYCTDNAAMIAITGYYKFLSSDFATFDITPNVSASV